VGHTDIPGKPALCSAENPDSRIMTYALNALPF